MFDLLKRFQSSVALERHYCPQQYYAFHCWSHQRLSAGFHESPSMSTGFRNVLFDFCADDVMASMEDELFVHPMPTMLLHLFPVCRYLWIYGKGFARQVVEIFSGKLAIHISFQRNACALAWNLIVYVLIYTTILELTITFNLLYSYISLTSSYISPIITRDMDD